jgi:hypothetical protein
MSTKITFLALTAAGMTLAGCGGSSSPAPTRPTKLYTARMTGHAARPATSSSAAGTAIIAFHGSSKVCWRFAHLHGFVNATGAEIGKGPAGHRGTTVLTLSTPPKLHHRGCLAISSTLSTQIWADPGAFYVTVDSAQHPKGAIRAQL